MRLDTSFRFVDDHLNDCLRQLITQTKLDHRIDRDGVIHYRAQDAEALENDVICSVRDQAFDSWQILSCPADWTDQYKRYMSAHEIPFHEELIDNEICFLLPRKYRPNKWKLELRKPRQKAQIAG